MPRTYGKVATLMAPFRRGERRCGAEKTGNSQVEACEPPQDLIQPVGGKVVAASGMRIARSRHVSVGFREVENVVSATTSVI